MVGEKKKCSKCGEEKGLGAFTKMGLTKNRKKIRFRSQCKACESAERKAKNPRIPKKLKKEKVGKSVWNKKHAERLRAIHLTRYWPGSTSELALTNYLTLLHAQNSSCFICFRNQSGMKYRLAVDHCHQTGKVRGLLCGHCNTALGKFQDEPERLERAAAYLRAHAS